MTAPVSTRGDPASTREPHLNTRGLQHAQSSARVPPTSIDATPDSTRGASASARAAPTGTHSPRIAFCFNYYLSNVTNLRFWLEKFESIAGSKKSNESFVTDTKLGTLYQS